jgi:glycosyltransferase involved in cell wall biosynthesis
MKILHVTALPALAPGHRKQLHQEVLAAKEARLQWDTVALQTDPVQNEFEKQVPRMWRSAPMLRLYRWIYVISKSRDYDLILLRALSLDVFGPFMGLFATNRVTVHHTKELEEIPVLKSGPIVKQLSALIERYLTPLTMRSATGLAAVTREIRDYQVARFPHLKNRSLVLPNGYHFGETLPAEDKRSNTSVTFTFVSATFAEWHGLDRLLEAIRTDTSTREKLIRIHLVGVITDEQREAVDKTVRNGIEITIHGVLDFEEIQYLLDSTNVALGSLALDRKNLEGASTLKVREYLASGIPVYATHLDTALPKDFPFFYADTNVSLQRMLEYAEAMTEYSRQEVRAASKVFLDKELILKRAVSELEDLQRQSSF